MRICYLSHANNYHTIKWCRWFSQKGHKILVLSLEECTNEEMLSLDGVEIKWLKNSARRDSSSFKKLSYLLTVRQARKAVDQFKPDIVHAHYASSYGLVAALALHNDYYLSVWGSDIYDMPKRSILHKFVIRYALKRATWVMSTSKAMAEETRKYTSKDIYITPFGVDMKLFSPERRTRNQDDGRFIVGTVKALEPKYGIDILLKGSAEAITICPELPLEIRIAGKGSQREALEVLASELGIADRVTWLGFISQQEAAQEWANMDAAVIMSESESESFGVSSVEAQACCVPVLYSNVPGLMEVCESGKNGVCIKRSDYNTLAYEIIRLYNNRDLSYQIGRAERAFVVANYDVDSCFRDILNTYIQHFSISNEVANNKEY